MSAKLDIASKSEVWRLSPGKWDLFRSWVADLDYRQTTLELNKRLHAPVLSDADLENFILKNRLLEFLESDKEAA
jgi:hypothetical protein